LNFQVAKAKWVATMSILAPAPKRDKPKLLDQVRDVIRRKQYSIRTEQAYIDWIKPFILYHNKRHPAKVAEEEVTNFSLASRVKQT
jgi:hypothetical protein